MDLKEKYDSIKSFILNDIWAQDTDNFTKKKRYLYNISKVLIVSIKGFLEDKCVVRASALTFFTLLSIVPVLALIFAISKGFGADEFLTDYIKESLAAYPTIADYLLQFTNGMLANTKSGVIAGVGIFALIYAVFKLLKNIEDAFNFMWNIKQSRPLIRQVTDYVTIMLIAPILLVLASGASVFVHSYLKNLMEQGGALANIAPILVFLVKFSPYFLLWVTFAIVYLIMPNTKVKIGAAIIAGVVTGTIFQLVQWVYIEFQVGANKAGAVYGSFAALPLFLAWLQTAWIIVLFGCELAYSVQNVKRYSLERLDNRDVSFFRQKQIAVMVMHILIERFKSGTKPPSSNTIADTLKVSQRLCENIMEKLVACKLLVELKNEDSDKAYKHYYYPAIDISVITDELIEDKIEHLGD